MLTGNISVIVPAVVQIYIVSNNTTGSYTLTVKTASGTGIVVSQGSTAILYCDGTNVNNAYTATISGSLVLNDGSYASPTLSFTAQPGTGLYSAGSNTFSAAANAAQVMQWAAQGSAVNYFGAVATATGVAPTLGVSGTDMNINLSLVPKGSGYVTCGYLDSTVIGANVPSPASFTTLSASSTISGSGFSTYLASPPAIGGTAAAAITGTTITASTQFSGPGTGLTGTASGLNIGGNASTATTATTVTGSIGSSATGTTQTAGNSSTLIATTAFVNGTALTLAAGTTAVTQTAGDNSTKVANTAYVDRGSSGASMVLLGTASASNSVAIQFTGLMTSSYTEYLVVFSSVIPATNGSLFGLQVGETGTIKSGANYEWHYNYSASNNIGGSSGSTTGTNINLFNTTGNSATNGGVNGEVRIYNPSSSAGYKAIDYRTTAFDGTNYYSFNGGAHWLGDTGAITDLNFFFVGSNMTSGVFQLYGRRNA